MAGSEGAPTKTGLAAGKLLPKRKLLLVGCAVVAALVVGAVIFIALVPGQSGATSFRQSGAMTTGCPGGGGCTYGYDKVFPLVNAGNSASTTLVLYWQFSTNVTFEEGYVAILEVDGANAVSMLSQGVGLSGSTTLHGSGPFNILVSTGVPTDPTVVSTVTGTVWGTTS